MPIRPLTRSLFFCVVIPCAAFGALMAGNGDAELWVGNAELVSYVLIAATLVMVAFAAIGASRSENPLPWLGTVAASLAVALIFVTVLDYDKSLKMAAHYLTLTANVGAAVFVPLLQ